MNHTCTGCFKLVFTVFKKLLATKSKNLSLKVQWIEKIYHFLQSQWCGLMMLTEQSFFTPEKKPPDILRNLCRSSRAPRKKTLTFLFHKFKKKMMNYGNMSKKLILEIFDPSLIPNKTGLSGEIFIMLFYSRTQFFFFLRREVKRVHENGLRGFLRLLSLNGSYVQIFKNLYK